MSLERPHITDIQRGDQFNFWGLYDPRTDPRHFDVPVDERRKPTPLVVLSISITGQVCMRREDMLDRDGHHPLMSIPLSDMKAMIEQGILQIAGNVDPFINIGKLEEGTNHAT